MPHTWWFQLWSSEVQNQSLLSSCSLQLHGCSPSGPSVHGTSQTGILEWVAISFFKGSSPPQDRTCVSCIGRRIPYHWAIREASKASASGSKSRCWQGHIPSLRGPRREYVPCSFLWLQASRPWLVAVSLQSQLLLPFASFLSVAVLNSLYTCCKESTMAFTAHPACCRSVATDSVLLNGVQHDKLPCPSLSPGFCLNSYPLSWWHCATISSSVSLFSSCPQSFPTSGSFPTSWLFAPGGQSIGASASASVLPMNIQDLFPLGWTGLISLAVQGTLKSLLQHHNLKVSIFQLPAFFMVQLSHLYMTTGKNHSINRTDLCQQNDVSAFKYTL